MIVEPSRRNNKSTTKSLRVGCLLSHMSRFAFCWLAMYDATVPLFLLTLNGVSWYDSNLTRQRQIDHRHRLETDTPTAADSDNPLPFRTHVTSDAYITQYWRTKPWYMYTTSSRAFPVWCDRYYCYGGLVVYHCIDSMANFGSWYGKWLHTHSNTHLRVHASLPSDVLFQTKKVKKVRRKQMAFVVPIQYMHQKLLHNATRNIIIIPTTFFTAIQ